VTEAKVDNSEGSWLPDGHDGTHGDSEEHGRRQKKQVGCWQINPTAAVLHSTAKVSRHCSPKNVASAATALAGTLRMPV
jgi:hypothetical protein